MGTFTLPLKAVIAKEAPTLDKYQACGLDTYDIFNEEHRQTLNDKIIDHFFNQEIGQETISIWRHAMRRRMNELMPEMNQHYVLSLKQAGLDPLLTLSLKQTGSGTSTGTNTTNGTSEGSSGNKSTSDASSRAVASETPQTALQENADYATSMQDNIGKTTVDGTATDTREDSQSSTDNQEQSNESEQIGYTGHAHSLLMQARATIVNVDMMIINELQKDMFMLVWHNNDSFNQDRTGYYGGYFGRIY